MRENTSAKTLFNFCDLGWKALKLIVFLSWSPTCRFTQVIKCLINKFNSISGPFIFKHTGLEPNFHPFPGKYWEIRPNFEPTNKRVRERNRKMLHINLNINLFFRNTDRAEPRGFDHTFLVSNTSTACQTCDSKQAFPTYFRPLCDTLVASFWLIVAKNRRHMLEWDVTCYASDRMTLKVWPKLYKWPALT